MYIYNYIYVICLSYVFHMSLICLSYVFHMSFICLSYVSHMSLICLSYVFHMSFICLSYVFNMSFICLSYVFHMSFICLSYVFHMSFISYPFLPIPNHATRLRRSRIVLKARHRRECLADLGVAPRMRCFPGRQPTCPPPMVGNGGFMWANDGTGCEKGWENGGRSWVMVESVEYWVGGRCWLWMMKRFFRRVPTNQGRIARSILLQVTNMRNMWMMGICTTCLPRILLNASSNGLTRPNSSDH